MTFFIKTGDADIKLNFFTLLLEELTNSSRKLSKVVAQRCSAKKVFLEIFQNSQENTCAQVSWPATFLKKRLWHNCFPVNFTKFLRRPFLTEHIRWLLLNFENISKDFRSTVFQSFYRELYSELSYKPLIIF